MKAKSVHRTHRLVIISGPSCVGKSPLVKALARFYPELHASLAPLVLYNSRAPRPGERDGVDYHFRPRPYIARLRKSRDFAVLKVRGDLQALDLKELGKILPHSDALFEGNPFVGHLLLTHPRLAHFPRISLFISPLSQAEIQAIRQSAGSVSLQDFITDVMRRKLLRRTLRQKGVLSLRDLENIERRAGSAFRELGYAHEFDHVIVNHDGEDSEHWDAFPTPIGDARKTLETVVAVLQGQHHVSTEHWPRTLI
jgi:guanylate kinase